MDTKFGTNASNKIYWMLQNARLTAFTISELLRKKQYGGWNTQIRDKKTTLKRFYSDSSLSAKSLILETFPCQEICRFSFFESKTKKYKSNEKTQWLLKNKNYNIEINTIKLRRECLIQKSTPGNKPFYGRKI